MSFESRNRISFGRGQLLRQFRENAFRSYGGRTGSGNQMRNEARLMYGTGEIAFLGLHQFAMRRLRNKNIRWQL